MSGGASSAANPLSRVALAVPEGLGLGLSLAGRGTGVALALYIAVDQSYNRTEVLAIGVAVVALATLAASLATKSAWFPALGGSALFFVGALLWSVDAGIAMLVTGTLAAIGTVLHTHRAGLPLDAPVSAFFVGFGLTSAGVVVLLLLVRG